MKKKKMHHEEHVDETWLIPYADMLTLLLALFIVMFAMSELNKEKFKKVGDQFNIIFSGGAGLLQENSNIDTQLKETGPEPPVTSNNVIEDDRMKEVMARLQQEIQNNEYASKVKVELNEGGLEISIQDAVLFNSGDAKVLKEVEPLLLYISNMLKGMDNNIKIVGHTDNIPINNERFRSNWDLSAMRAVNVMNFMVDAGGLNPRNVSIQAYAEYMPKYDNSTKEGRAKNRRVEIHIVRKYSAPDSSKNSN